MKYRASPALEAYILAVAPEHDADYDAPYTYTALCATMAKLGVGDPVPVPPCDSNEGTIFSSTEVLEALMAWVYETHYNESLNFTMDDRVQATDQQVKDAESMAVEYDLTERDIIALELVLHGVAKYNRQHAVPIMEADRFIASCLRSGLDKVLKSYEVF